MKNKDDLYNDEEKALLNKGGLSMTLMLIIWIGALIYSHFTKTDPSFNLLIVMVLGCPFLFYAYRQMRKAEKSMIARHGDKLVRRSLFGELLLKFKHKKQR